MISTVYDRNFAVLPMKKDQKAPEKAPAKKVSFCCCCCVIIIFKIYFLMLIFVFYQLFKQKESIADANSENQSIQQLVDSKSYIVIDIKLEKPLIPRKPFEQLATR